MPFVPFAIAIAIDIGIITEFTMKMTFLLHMYQLHKKHECQAHT